MSSGISGRNKTISLIHVASFALGIATFLFAAQTIIFEYSFDNFHQNGDRILEITMTNQVPGNPVRFTRIDPALAHRIKGTIPEIEYVARYIPQSLEEPFFIVTQLDDQGNRRSFHESGAFYADEDFLKILEFPLVAGNRENALIDNSSMVITKSTARRYFGDEDAIGKVLEVSTGNAESKKTIFSYKISAVLEDLPANSSLQFDFLLPFKNFEENYRQDIPNLWGWYGCFRTFILTRNQLKDFGPLEAQINKVVPSTEGWNTYDMKFQYNVVPLNTIHFDPDEGQDLRWMEWSSKPLVIMVGLIGVIILLVAAVNYINLTTARALKRTKEVGIRTVVGASRNHLIRLFMLEAFVVIMLGSFLALTLLQIVKPIIAAWIGLKVPQIDWFDSSTLIFFFFLIFITLVSGLVPALFLTRVRPVMALKGKLTQLAGSGNMRKILVVFQFAISVILIVMTNTVLRQLNHMRSKDVGFDQAQRITMRVAVDDVDFKKYRTFKARILTNPKILSVTGGFSIPGYYRISDQPFSVDSSQQKLHQRIIVSDYDYMKTLNIKMLAGSEFIEDRMTDERVALISESSVRDFGFNSPDDAIGRHIVYHWLEGNVILKIIGVAEDINAYSPGYSVRGTVYLFANTAHPYPKYSHYVAHVAPGQLDETISYLKAEWYKIFGNAPFEYAFLDEAFQKVFEGEERMQSISLISTVMAILIACMGLGGLVSYSVNQRTKEIGIRKVLGASVSRILIILSKDFLKLIVMATMFAIPIVWFAVEDFLTHYNYRIEISAWIFITPCLILFLIATATIIFQTVNAATSNPVEALKHE